MLLKEYAPMWPPATPEKANLDDVVSEITIFEKGKIGLVIRKTGLDLTVPLSVPASLQQRIIFDILRKKKITLREIGELPIA